MLCLINGHQGYTPVRAPPSWTKSCFHEIMSYYAIVIGPQAGIKLAQGALDRMPCGNHKSEAKNPNVWISNHQ